MKAGDKKLIVEDEEETDGEQVEVKKISTGFGSQVLNIRDE